MSASHASTKAPPPLLDVHKLFRILLEGWLWIAAAILVCLALGLLVIARSATAYVATAIVQVPNYEQNVVDIPDIQGTRVNDIESFKTIESNLPSRPIMEAILANKAYGITPSVLGLGGKSGATPPNVLLRALRSKVNVEVERGTRRIGVSAEDGDPEVAATIANAVVTEFLRLQFEQRLSASGSAKSFLGEEAERLQVKLNQSEARLQKYLKDTQAVSLNDSQNIIVEQMKELNAKVTEAKTERLELEAARAQIQSVPPEDALSLLGITRIAENTAVQAQSRQVAEMEAQVANLNERYLEKHPKMIQARGQLEELRKELSRSIMKAAQSIDTRYSAAQETERKFSEALAEQEAKAIGLTGISVDYKSLSREVESDRQLFDAVQKRLKETDITAGLRDDVVQLVEPAVPPDYPVKPRKKLIAVGALALGVMLGFGLVLARSFLDNTFRTVDEAEKALGLRAFAAIPLEPKAGSGQALVLSTSPNGHAAEALRTLRTSLALLGENKTVLFSSALQGEGKTFCSMNYAAGAADAGERILLIDADLRLPSIEAELFGRPEKPGPGLSDVLQGAVTFEAAVRKHSIPGLEVLCAGTALKKPAELLARRELAELLVRVAQTYDRVVIDAAPLSAVSDGLLLARHAEVVCLVIRAGQTPPKAIKRVIGDLQDAGTPPSGFVLNGVPVDAKGYYYHYTSGTYGSGVYGAAGS